MSDYGFRISRNGVDVKTGDDKDMVVNSKYANLKGTLSGSGSVEVARDSADHTVTIAHNLGYIPIVQAFWNDYDEFHFLNTEYYPLPFYRLGVGEEINFRVKADATNIYLIFKINDFDV